MRIVIWKPRRFGRYDLNPQLPSTGVVLGLEIIWLYLGLREMTVSLIVIALSGAVGVCSEDDEFQEEDPSPVIT
ncbi:UNVERIFIED_CONTAM: hypothetical protein Slati_2480600 [Sesamum latifolium]|uniref:Uncharacterized protein n=1 Tax=Sesamum latifolium TaxID=2727402 RepID=A0AAW2WJ07_9LAMI